MWFVVRTPEGPKVRSLYMRYGTPGMRGYWARSEAEAEVRRLVGAGSRSGLRASPRRSPVTREARPRTGLHQGCRSARSL